MNRLLAACAACLLAACATGGTPPSSVFAFALLGDAPYRRADEPRFAAMLRQLDDDDTLHFVLHAGDIKGGGESCADALLLRRLAQLRAMRKALVYTPGDNEWTDCHRPAAGRFHPLERLAALRRLAFADPQRSFGRYPLALQSQAAEPPHRQFVENARFSHGDVVFVSLHAVGGNNGLQPWRGIDSGDRAEAPRAERVAEFEQREQANLAWLRAAFAQARATSATAVVVLMHANPRFELPAGDRARAGFERLIDELSRQSRDFGRPVLLAHGDGHVFIDDLPLAEAEPPAANLRRVQTYGYPWLGWVRIEVDRRRPEVFAVRLGVLAEPDQR
jgi:hypothetical protein